MRVVPGWWRHRLLEWRLRSLEVAIGENEHAPEDVAWENEVQSVRDCSVQLYSTSKISKDSYERLQLRMETINSLIEKGANPIIDKSADVGLL